VPLTVNLCRLAGMAPARLIVFQALAVNAGSALTPIGNPQNLFFWQRAQLPFAHFVAQLLPLVAWQLGALLVLTACAFRGRALRAIAVNVGGFGCVLGSLANLIALRLAGDRAAWREFHCWSIPFLVVVAAGCYAAMFWGR